MNETFEPINDRFSLPQEQLKVGERYVCERSSKIQWHFVGPFGWKHDTLQDGTRVLLVPAPSYAAAMLIGGPQSNLSGVIVNKDGVSYLRRSTTVIAGKEYHEDAKLWDGDTIEIIDLPA